MAGTTLTCANCAAVNPEGAAFCMRCGQSLAPICANCSAELPPEAAFCVRCGTPVAATPSPPSAAPSTDGLRRYIPAELLTKLESTGDAMKGERRRVSMLFCDVQGSTAAAERLDPEEWADIMNGAFEHLIAPVYRYEGTLARLMGDAILAFFGAPIGHEDDPERAVRAGLEIVADIQGYRAEVLSRWGIDLDVRVGINTGLVVVGAMGSDLRVEYTAMGDAVNVAARMEQTAAPGTVQISDATHRLVPRLFEFEALGAIDVKGRSEPVPAFRVRGTVARPDTTRGIEGLHSPMIGRADQLAVLSGAVDTLLSGQGRIVSVTGEAGLGKSRLVAELRTQLSADGRIETLRWLEARSLSYEANTPFATMRRLVRRAAGITEDTDPEAAWSTVEALAREAVPGRLSAVAPLLGTLIDAAVPDTHQPTFAFLEPGQLREAMFRATTDVLHGLAGRQPLVVVFEDLHWADSATIELATTLLDSAESHPIAIVLVHRPRRSESSWTVHEEAERAHPHLYETVELAALDDEQSRTLVSSLLAIDGLPDPIRDTILARSEGNPFFMEEVIRSMIDQQLVVHRDGRWVADADVADMVVPDTLAAVITTRLDSLAPHPRRTVQAASVIGREFRYDELAAVLTDLSGVDDALVDLQRRDLVRQIARTPRRAFRFKHALVQATVYETVLRKNRSEMHAALAGHLQRLHPERVDDIADHLLAAGQPDAALPFLLEAGERALRTFALPEGVGRLERALDILGDDPDPALLRRALERIGQAKEFQYDFAGAAAVYERLRDEGVRREIPAMAISGKNKSALVFGMGLQNRELALSVLDEAERDARAGGDDAGLAEACMFQCMLRTGSGEFDDVAYYMSEMSRLGVGLEDPYTITFGMVHLANTYAYTNRAAEAIEQGLAALAAAEQHGDLKHQAELLTFALPFGHLQRGELEEAMGYVERGMEIAMRIGDRMSETVGSAFQGKLAMLQGNFEDALALFRRTEEAAAATGVPYFASLGKCVIGSCYLSIGGPYIDTALDFHREALAMTEAPMGDIMGAWIWSEIGACSLAAGSVDLAEELFHRALERQTAAMYMMRPAALKGLCDVALVRGDVPVAGEYLESLRTYVAEHEMHNFELTVLRAEAMVRAAEGDAGAALQAIDQCRDLAGRSGLRREQLWAAAARHRVLADCGDHAAAALARQEVEQLSVEIGTGIRDAELRAGFESSIEQLLAEPATLP